MPERFAARLTCLSSRWPKKLERSRGVTCSSSRSTWPIPLTTTLCFSLNWTLWPSLKMDIYLAGGGGGQGKTFLGGFVNRWWIPLWGGGRPWIPRVLSFNC